MWPVQESFQDLRHLVFRLGIRGLDILLELPHCSWKTSIGYVLMTGHIWARQFLESFTGQTNISASCRKSEAYVGQSGIHAWVQGKWRLCPVDKIQTHLTRTQHVLLLNIFYVVPVSALGKFSRGAHQQQGIGQITMAALATRGLLSNQQEGSCERH